MNDDATIDPDIDRLVRAAPTLREAVLNTVMLAERHIDHERYVREIDPRLVLAGLNAAQRFDRIVTAAGGFDTDPELIQCGNCFMFSILGYAYDLSVALPGLTDAQLERRAVKVYQAICEFPDEYLPDSWRGDETPAGPTDAAVEADEDEATVLRQLFASALVCLQGWFIGVYTPIEDVASPVGEDADEADAWEPRHQGGTCNFVMAD